MNPARSLRPNRSAHSTASRRHATPSSRLRRSVAAALLVLPGLGCSDGPLGGPGLSTGRPALRMQPRFEARASVSAFSVTHVRVGVRRIPGGEAVMDTVAVFGTGQGGAAELDLEVPLLHAGERFQVRLAAADAAGDTIFRAVDTVLVERGAGAFARAQEVLLRYSGPDTRFASIQVGPRDTTILAGDALGLWVVGRRPGSADAEPLAHVAWSSSDPSAVSVSQTGGRATAHLAGRSAWIRAHTAAGLADSTRITVRNAVATIDIQPGAVTLPAGSATALAAVVRDPAGQPVAVEAVAWSSSDPSIATISATGSLAAVAPGQATITATAAGVSARVTVTVTVAPVATVVIDSRTLQLSTGQDGQIDAHGVDAQGRTVAGAVATFTSSAPAVATVSADGLVSAVAIGEATITVAMGGVSGTVKVKVTAPPPNSVVVSPAAITIHEGAVRTLQAQLTDAAGGTVPGATVSWRSADNSVAAVSPVGLVSAVGIGSTTITATAGGKSGETTVTVIAAPVASVAVEPSSLSLTVGAGRQVVATPLDAAGSPLGGRTVSWSSSAPSVARVGAQGFVTAIAPGTATITATSERKSGRVSVVVQAVPVASVEVTPQGVSLAPGGFQQFAATARDIHGTVLTGRTVSWSSSSPGVASIAADGRATMVAPGAATITATIGGVKGSSTVSVVAPEARTVRVTPGADTIVVGEAVQLSAQSFVGMEATSTTFTWTSRAPGVAPVSGTGLVNGVSTGKTWIVATDGAGASDSAAITVVVRKPLDFDLPAAQIGFHQRWGIGGSARQICRPDADPNALPVKLRSLDDARAELPSTTVSILPGTRCVAFDLQGNGEGGEVRLIASAAPDGGVEWLPDTMTVTVGTPRLRLIYPAQLEAGQSPSVVVQTTGPDGVPRFNTQAVPVQLQSSSQGVASWSVATINVPAGSGSAAVALNVTGAGGATLTAFDLRTSASHRYATHDTTVVARAAGGGRLSIAPASFTYAIGQTVTGQTVKVPGLLGLSAVTLTSSDGTIATVPGSLSILAGTSKEFAVTGKKAGMVQITADALGLAPATVTVEVRAGTLKAEGWGGSIREGDYLRVWLHAAGGDGTATDAKFATATEFRVRYDGRIEVYEDRYPSGSPGRVSGSSKGSSIESGAIIRPVVGQRYISLIVRARDEGSTSLTIEAPDGTYTRLDLTGLNVYDSSGD